MPAVTGDGSGEAGARLGGSSSGPLYGMGGECAWDVVVCSVDRLFSTGSFAVGKH